MVSGHAVSRVRELVRYGQPFSGRDGKRRAGNRQRSGFGAKKAVV